MTMNNNQDRLIVLGAGGHGRVVADAADASGRFATIAFLDDKFPTLRQVGPWPVIGRSAAAAMLRDEFNCAAIGVGDNRARLGLMREARRLGFDLPAIIHPSATVSQHASLGRATAVLARAVVNYGAVIGDGVIINSAAVVEHDCRVSDGAHVSPGAVLGGGVAVGHCSWIGIGASVRHATVIGDHVQIGAGAAVVSAIPAGSTAVGVPARVVRKQQTSDIFRGMDMTLGKKIAAISAWPMFEADEIDMATQVLKSGKVNYWTGDECRNFETEYADFVGTKFAIAVANGTVALELALYAFGIGLGDEVITTSRTYIASASCVVMRGATPIIVDVDRDTQNISPAAIRAAITPRTRAIIVVHLAGWPCDMDAIMAIAAEFGLKVIEDCAQAHGATYKGRQVGSIGHAGAFSFCQDKIISTGGEGGMMTTNDEVIWERAWAYKDIGRSYDAVYRREHPPGFRWLTETFGTNWRLTEVQGAIGRLQLRKLPAWIAQRQKNAARLTALFQATPAVRMPVPPADIGHAYYKFYVFVKPELLGAGWDRDRLVTELNARGVPCFTGSCSEIYLEKAFDTISARPAERLPVAQELGETSMMFLVHPTITAAWFDAALAQIDDVFTLASRAVAVDEVSGELLSVDLLG